MIISVILFSHFANAQKENWDVYLADYDGKPGSTVVDMGLLSIAPNKIFKYLVVTGVKTDKCLESGFPEDAEFKILYKISDSVKTILTSVSAGRMAGTFTNRCERLDYYYVADTASIRTALIKMYSTSYPEYSYSVSVKEDKEWKGYLTFLYPNEETQELMSNQDVLDGLIESGDNLTKARNVDHWIYFKTKSDREKFQERIKAMSFSTETGKSKANDGLKFKLILSRVDKVDLNSITELTSKLRKLAAEFNGDYDGWETSVEKE